MKLAIIGTKKFNDYNLLSSKIENISNIEQIISGGAPGADTLAKKYAKLNGIPFLEFPPNYEKYRDKAKHIRDDLITDHCDKLLAFWDGECEGTKYTIERAKKLEKEVIIIKVMVTS